MGSGKIIDNTRKDDINIKNEPFKLLGRMVPSCQKQGVGSALVKTALNALGGLGIGKVALAVFERNADGNAFWEKQGFTVTRDLTYGNKSLVEMERVDT